MLTSPGARFYDECSQPLTAAALGDPSLTLVECGPAYFGAILSDGCYQNSWSPWLFLEQSIWFRASRFNMVFARIGEVILSEEAGLSSIQHKATERYIPNLSLQPHRTIFLTAYEHHRMERILEANKGSFFFNAVQRHFGHLPGFETRDNALTTPPGYAEIPPDQSRALKVA